MLIPGRMLKECTKNYRYLGKTFSKKKSNGKNKRIKFNSVTKVITKEILIRCKMKLFP